MASYIEKLETENKALYKIIENLRKERDEHRSYIVEIAQISGIQYHEPQRLQSFVYTMRDWIADYKRVVSERDELQEIFNYSKNTSQNLNISLKDQCYMLVSRLRYAEEKLQRIMYWARCRCSSCRRKVCDHYGENRQIGCGDWQYPVEWDKPR